MTSQLRRAALKKCSFSTGFEPQPCASIPIRLTTVPPPLSSNSIIGSSMDLFSEIEDLNNLFCGERDNEINFGNGFDDLQNKYSSLHENYSKEVDNTRKVGKSLAKCLKFYSKLCKKYEVQQKLISNLELTIKEKNSIIEESQKNIEKMTGLIRMYESERTSYKGPSCDELRRDRELLLDICCQLMGEAIKGSNTTRNLGKLLLRKFRKDLSNEKIRVIKQKMVKNEDRWVDIVKPPDLLDFTKTEFKEEEKYSKELKEEETAKESEAVPMEVGVIEEEEDEPEELEIVAIEKEKRLEGGCNLCANDLPSLPLLENTIDVLQLINDVTKSSKPAISIVTPPLDKIVQPACPDQHASKSIFDINISNDNFASETVEIDTEITFGANIEKSPPREKESTSLEDEVKRVLMEMKLPRLLSPLRVVEEENMLPVVPETSKGCELTLGEKRPREGGDTLPENLRKRKSPKKLSPGGPLDSIISAMSIQDEIFKSSTVTKESSFRCTRSVTRVNSMTNLDEDKGSTKENVSAQKNKQQAEEKLVRKGLNEFVSTPIASKEDADKNVRHCLGILSNKSEELIAKTIVAMVLENVDEPVEVFERPAPPLTKTQHRLFVLLSVFKKLDPKSEKIPPLILSMISKKLFPDNFFWPDDSVESATRFYAALCRSKNDTKNLWRFCIHAMTSMRQRCPVAVFAVLQTWPDVLHDASTLKNILPLTVVNLFLHMPKVEGLRSLNQKRKLLALKHLLMNFYQYKIEDTIENYTKKVFESFLKDEVGAKKSFVMLVKCRDADWAVKSVVPVLKSAILDWGHGKMDDETAERILSVIKQICPVLSEAKDRNETKVKEMVGSFCGILTSGSKSHESELKVVEVLLQLKHHGEARKAISEWVPKKPIDNVLRDEIINMSAENVLREWKQNRGKEQKISPTKRKRKKKLKSKKMRKGKKRKNSSANNSHVSS